MLPKAILLDMDDTIISFDDGIDLDCCWKKSMQQILQVDDAQVNFIISLIKKQAKWFWSDPERHRLGRLDLDKARIEIVSTALQETKFQDRKISERIAIDYGIVRDEAVILYPGAFETLQYLRENEYKLALITNGSSHSQRNKIEKFGLAPFFDCIIIEEEFGVGKPRERVYLHAVEQLDVNINEAWIIGDNFEWEVAAPQKLGIKSIWINPKGIECPSFETPHITIKTLSDIKDYLAKDHLKPTN